MNWRYGAPLPPGKLLCQKAHALYGLSAGDVQVGGSFTEAGVVRARVCTKGFKGEWLPAPVDICLAQH